MGILGQELIRWNIQKKADNPSKNYAIGEIKRLGINSMGLNSCFLKKKPAEFP
jgi:hypothetical protein